MPYVSETSLVKQLFDTIKCGIVMVDSKTREIVYVNNEALVMIGCTRETLVGRSCTEYFCKQDPTACPILDSGMFLEDYETFIDRLDGSRIVVSKTVNNIIYDGKMYLVESFIDITDIKKSEARVHSLLKISESKLKSEEEIAKFALDEAVKLTNSKIGYLHLVNNDASGDVSLNSFVWSSIQNEMPCTAAYDKHYSLEKAGMWADCIRTGKPAIHNDYANELHKKLPEGHFLVKRHLSVPVTNGNDEIVAIMGVGNKENFYSEFDIEQLQLFANSAWQIIKRKRLDRDLACSKTRYKNLVEKAPAAIYEVDFSDPELKVITADGAIEQMSGYSKEELLSMSSVDLLLPEDQKKYRDRVKNVSKGKKIPTTETYRVLTKDGSVKQSFLKVNFRKREEDNHIIAYVIAVDVTDLKELEQKSQTYLQLAPSVFVILDPDGNINFINNFGMELLECDESVFGKNWFDLFIKEEDRNQLVRFFNELSSGQNELSVKENEVITSKGNTRIIAWRNTVLRNLSGEIVEVISAGHDVTEERLYEKVLDIHWKEEESRLKKHLQPLSILANKNSLGV